MKHRFGLVGLWACAGAAIFAGAVATAALPGRKWLPVDTLEVSDHSWIAPQEIWADTSGRPVLVAEGLGGIGQRLLGLTWSGDAWEQDWTAPYGTAFARRGPAPTGRIPLFWQGIEYRKGLPLGTYASLTAVDYAHAGLAVPDTVAWVWAGDFTYAGAASPLRRWVAKGDYGDLRVWYSDTVGLWREVDVPGRGDQGDAIASVDDTTAIVVWMDFLRDGGWGIVRGSTWEGVQLLPIHDGASGAPLLRHRRAGGHWLAWCTDNAYVVVSHLDSIRGEWSEPESLQCAYRNPGTYYSKSVHLSFDDHNYPVASWSSYNGDNGSEEICVCVPSDSGFTVADNLVGSEDGLLPVATRDRNDDVWVAWWKYYDGMFWTHTYTVATCSAPRITATAGQTSVAWTLSEPAPGSYWAVLRASGEGSFEEVARVKASSSLEHSWADTSTPPGTVRYRIRRECIDRAYEWLSPEGRWPASESGLRLVRISSHPSTQSVDFDILDAAPGPIEIRLLDLQGRERGQFDRIASGLGVDRLQIPLATEPGLKSGIYFLRVRDSSGAVTKAEKVVVLR